MEAGKLIYDMLKNLVTLDSALLLLMAGMVERVLHRKCTFVVILMFISVIVSLLSSEFLMLAVVARIGEAEMTNTKLSEVPFVAAGYEIAFIAFAILASPGGFLLGLFLLCGLLLAHRTSKPAQKD